MKHLHINCDLESGEENAALLMPFIAACHIPCGGHAGNPESISTLLKLAKEYGVKCGAHPSYPDRANFGRVTPDIPRGELKRSLRQQLHLFVSQAQTLDSTADHIKAHGALYNDLYRNDDLCTLYLEAAGPYKGNCTLYVQPGSRLSIMAVQDGFQITPEAFIDRRYQDDGTLLPRSHPDALITNPEQALQQYLTLRENHSAVSVTGKEIHLQAETFCLHGDNPNALEICRHIREHFHMI